MIEQRKHKRFELQLPFEIVQIGNLSMVHGETMNMSSSGVLFTSEAEIPVGEPIEYLVTLPNNPGADAEIRLRCMGKVLRVNGESSYAATLERYEFIRQPITSVLERGMSASPRLWA